MRLCESCIPRIGVLFVLALLALGCDDGGNSADTSSTDEGNTDDASPTEGIWLSRGYGMLMQIESSEVTMYEITDIHCLSVFTDLLGSLGTVALDDEEDVLTLAFHDAFTQYDFDRLGELPTLCRDENPDDATDDLVNFDILWQTFSEHYAFFELRGVDWEATRETWRPQVGTRDLFEIFVEMLTPLGDPHVMFFRDDQYFNTGWEALISRLPDIAEDMAAQEEIDDVEEFLFSWVGENLDVVIEDYLDPQTTQIGFRDQLLWGRLADDSSIGYLNVLGMEDYCLFCDDPDATVESVMEEVVSQLGDVSTLIVDVRFNVGGSDVMAKGIAEYLTDKPRTGYIVKAVDGDGFTREQIMPLAGDRADRFNQDVILLISPMTASAAELFCLMVKDLPHIKTILGESTVGIYSAALDKSLPNGWEFTLSNEVCTDADGRLYEGVGVTPDETITAFTRYDRDNQVDTILDRAIAVAAE